jgi:hypothetical protein
MMGGGPGICFAQPGTCFFYFLCPHPFYFSPDEGTEFRWTPRGVSFSLSTISHSEGAMFFNEGGPGINPGTHS